MDFFQTYKTTHMKLKKKQNKLLKEQVLSIKELAHLKGGGSCPKVYCYACNNVNCPKSYQGLDGKES